MIEKKIMYKWIICILLIYIVFSCIFYIVGGEQIKVRNSDTGDVVTPKNITTEIVNEIYIVQPFTIDAQKIDSVDIQFMNYERINNGNIVLQIYHEENLLSQTSIKAADTMNFGFSRFVLPEPIEIEPNTPLAFVIFSEDSISGNAVSIAYGDSIVLPRGEFAKDIFDNALVNGVPIDGILCFKVNGRSELWFGSYFGYVMICGLIIIMAICVNTIYRFNKNQKSKILDIIAGCNKYKYLVHQLIQRDFKTKYKRSFLGFFWSFLNPLLTMLVYYLIFSALFQSNIENYPLYLLTGIVCFSFFNETTNLALDSIIGNASLITKVYVPKYIYPGTRVLSSLINLMISMIPLILIILTTKTQITGAILLLPFGICCMLMFCMGVSLFLSSAIVFFKDIRFLWGVISMLWMYATPIFYPESIIPSEVLTIFKLNPLYYFIKFVRIILIEGVSPPPYMYLYCLVMGIIPLIIGVGFFKKTQDKFVLYL